MAWGYESTFRFRETDLSPSETDRKRIDLTFPGANNDNSFCDFGTSGGVRYFRVRPLASGTDVGATPTFDFANVGWKADPDDWDSTSTRRRAIPGGVSIFITGFLITNAVTTTARLRFQLWKVAAGG